MRKIILDLMPMESAERIHDYLKFELELPEYYGANLDALYDELTGIGEDLCIGLFYPPDDAHGTYEYIRKVVKVFQDAEADNEHLCVVMGDLSDNYLCSPR